MVRDTDLDDNDRAMPEGFMPTVTDHRQEGNELILETLDPREETDLYTQPLERVGETYTEEQKEILQLHEQ